MSAYLPCARTPTLLILYVIVELKIKELKQKTKQKLKAGWGVGGGSEWVSKAYCLHESEPSSTSIINEHMAKSFGDSIQ